MARKRSERELVDNELARTLYREVERTSIREVAEGIGIGKTTLEHMLYKYVELPTLETIEKIARYLNKPAYEVMRLAGFDPQLPPDVDQGARLMQIAEQQPELRRVLRQLPKLDAEQTKSLLVYLEVLQRERQKADDE